MPTSCSSRSGTTGTRNPRLRTRIPRKHPLAGTRVATYITVEDESVDDVTNRAEENGIEISVPPHETNWNTRETTVHDPDGYELVFSERAEVGRELDEVMGSVEE